MPNVTEGLQIITKLANEPTWGGVGVIQFKVFGGRQGKSFQMKNCTKQTVRLHICSHFSSVAWRNPQNSNPLISRMANRSYERRMQPTSWFSSLLSICQSKRAKRKHMRRSTWQLGDDAKMSLGAFKKLKHLLDVFLPCESRRLTRI